MSTSFYFPCPNCDHKFEIETRAAGRQLTCPDCSAETEAPKMRDIRLLDPVEESVAPSKSSGQPGRAKAVLFSLGLASLVIFGALGAGLYYYSAGLEIPIDLNAGIEGQNKGLDQLNAAGLWDFYYEYMKDAPLGDWQEHGITKSNKQGSILKNFSYGLFGLAGLGLLSILGSFVVSGKK